MPSEQHLNDVWRELVQAIASATESADVMPSIYGSRPASAPAQYHSVPQEIADGYNLAAQAALAWCHASNRSRFRLSGEPAYGKGLTDDEIEQRCRGWQIGYMREFQRIPRHQEPYDLTLLPLSVKRALVERWNKITAVWLEQHPEIGLDLTESRFFIKSNDQDYEDPRPKNQAETWGNNYTQTSSSST